MPKRKPTDSGVGKPFDPDRGLERAEYLRSRSGDAACRIHKIPLAATGWCPVAQAWWFPRFACPDCATALWDNGFCPNCTPKTQMFPGDYFEQRWDDEAGREYGHFVRVSAGPLPVPDPEAVAGFLAELRAVAARVAPTPDDDPVPF